MSVLHTPKHIIVQLCLLGMVVFLASCSTHALREAQQVVAQADSLRSQGKLYEDSARLAQAYSTLNQWHYFYADDFVHACYHYGRLLRAKDNPVEAMQAFISATHSRSRDYHILGRVYSNMGDICHYASEYDLSYAMFESSANTFLLGGDSLLYYYGLNNMAYELAEQRKKEDAFSLLSFIEDNCTSIDVLLKALETKAEACLYAQQYDSALIYTSLLLSNDYIEPAWLLIRAQAHSFLGNNDSAVFYANCVLSVSKEIYEQNNALYILTQNDEARDVETVRETSAERADIQKLIEIKRSQYAQAAQILEMDINRVQDRYWLYLFSAFVLFVATIIILSGMWKKRKQHRQMMIDLQEKKRQQMELSNQIDNLSLMKTAHHNEIFTDIENFCNSIQSNQDIKIQLCWNNYEKMCEEVNRHMYSLVSQLQPYNLSEKEIRLCILVLLKASTDQMVNMIPYSKTGLGKFKYTTSKKIGTTTANMRSFILNLLG